MNATYKQILWNQFGAAIDMLENAMTVCPEEIWGSSAGFSEFWYIAYHTLFWLDLYLSGSVENFAPPAPFGLSELDPEGIMPEKIYTKEELLNYLEHSRKKCKTFIQNLTDEIAVKPYKFGSIELPLLELLIYNMRHVQHHTAQLNLILRQKIDSAPRWVKQARN